MAPTDAAPAATRFDADTAVRRVGAGLYEARIDRGWWVVAGPNGGYVAAILLRALAAELGDPARAPRSLTIHYTARPQEGAVRIETRLERRGRSLSTLTARLTQGDDRLLALALAAFALPQGEAGELSHAEMPAVPPPEACPPLAPRIPLNERYEYRWAIGSEPFSGGGEARSGGWIRLAEPRGLDAPLAAALCDAFPPAIFSARAGGAELPGGVPTVDLTLHFRSPLPGPDAASEPVLALFRTRLVREGFLEEDGELWSRDGRLLVQSRQLALLR